MLSVCSRSWSLLLWPTFVVGCASRLGGSAFGPGGGGTEPTPVSAAATVVQNGAAPGGREPGAEVQSVAGGGGKGGDTGGDVVEPAPPAPGPAVHGNGTCSARAERLAREEGLVGPCWDPPGAVEFAPPVTIAAGVRRMSPTSYWIDMPREARIEASYGCAELQTVEGSWFKYEPYADDGGRRAPQIPDLTGMTVEQVVAAMDGLEAPLCVSVVEWSTGCDAPIGHVCQQNFDPWTATVSVMVAIPE